MKTESKEYIRRLQGMSGEERIKIAADLSWTIRQITKSAIQNEHPDWSFFQIQDELLRRIYGTDICVQVSRARAK